MAGLLSFRTLQAAGRTGRQLATSGSTATGALASAVVFVLLASAVRYFVRSARLLMRASIDSRRLGPIRAGLIVVDDTVPTAFAVAGAPGHVVVSTAMLSALDVDERKVLLAHEAAHLRHHHHLYTQLAQLAAAANPLLRPLARVVTCHTERWADEVAAAEVGSRSLVARGLARAALARHAHARACGSELPQSAATLGAIDGQLAERIENLLAPAPQRARFVSAVVVAVALACGITGMTANFQAHQQIERLEVISGQ